jgi:hypothetical protein
VRKDRERRTPRFARAVVPPEKFHTTKKGKRGYSRPKTRDEERKAAQEEPKQNG